MLNTKCFCTSLCNIVKLYKIILYSYNQDLIFKLEVKFYFCHYKFKINQRALKFTYFY